MGLYEATIRISDGANMTNVPVVGQRGRIQHRLPVSAAAAPRPRRLTRTAEVGGYFDWTGRAESGDWRFFFLDAPDSTPAGTQPARRQPLERRKDGHRHARHGAGPGLLQQRGGLSNPSRAASPARRPAYGPYTLASVGGSDRLNPRAGVWLDNTSTGGPREMVAAPIKPGLNLVALHNTMFDGGERAETFQGQVGTITAAPNPVDLFVDGRASGRFR